MNKNDIILIGAFHEMIELCKAAKKNIIGIIDNNMTTEYMNIKILGSDKDAEKIIANYRNVPFVITPDSPRIREKLFLHYTNLGAQFATIIHPNANISLTAKIGIGTIIQLGTNISANVNLGDFVKVNTMANVMHDSNVGNFTTIAPNAVILGKVNINNYCYIGANSTILPNIHIAKNAIVGAGAVVTKNISKSTVMVGVPAKELK